MQKRLLIIALAVVFVVFVVLGFLVNSLFFYAVLVLAMIVLHLFGHGHGGHGQEDRKDQHQNHQTQRNCFGNMIFGLSWRSDFG